LYNFLFYFSPSATAATTRQLHKHLLRKRFHESAFLVIAVVTVLLSKFLQKTLQLFLAIHLLAAVAFLELFALLEHLQEVLGFFAVASPRGYRETATNFLVLAAVAFLGFANDLRGEEDNNRAAA